MFRRLAIFTALLSFLPRLALSAEVNNCPLIPRQAYEELFKSVDALGQDLQNLIKNCRNQNELAALKSAQDQLRASTGQLQQYWHDPALAATDQAAFAHQITAAIGSVNTISQNISNSALFKSACGDNAVHPNTLMSINEVVSNLAPLAMLAAPALATTVAKGSTKNIVTWILGVTGFTSLLNVLAAPEANKPNMDKAENRELVMRAACEYTRIQKRIHFLNLINQGEIDQLQSELATRKHELEESVKPYPELAAKVKSYQSRVVELDQNWLAFNRYRHHFRKEFSAFEQLRSTNNNDSLLQCSYLRSFADPAKAKSAYYPLSLTVQLQRYAKQSNSNAQAAVFSAFQSVNKDLSDKLPSIMSETIKVDECASLAQKWMISAVRALDETAVSLHSQQSALYQELNRDKAFAEWSDKVQDLEGQKIFYEKVIQFMSARKDKSVTVDRAEINQRLDEFKKFLFGDGDLATRYVPYSARSHVGAWLDNIQDRYKDELAEFEKRYMTLLNDSYTIAQTYPVAVKRDLDSRRVQNKGLNFLIPGLLKTNQYVCENLALAQVSWSKAQDYLDYLELFCTVIADTVRSRHDVDPKIVSMCAGKLRLDGEYESIPTYQELKKKQERPTRDAKWVVSMMNHLTYKNIESPLEKAQAVKAKQKDFKCTITAPPP